MCGITRGVSRGSLDTRARSIGWHRAAGLRCAVTSCRRRFSDLPRVTAFRAETAATHFVCVASSPSAREFHGRVQHGRQRVPQVWRVFHSPIRNGSLSATACMSLPSDAAGGNLPNLPFRCPTPFSHLRFKSLEADRRRPASARRSGRLRLSGSLTSERARRRMQNTRVRNEMTPSCPENAHSPHR